MSDRKVIIFLICLIPLIGRTSAFAEKDQTVVRETQVVVVNGMKEHWRLQWNGTPHPVCSPDDPNWMTCPCMGFAFGEGGDLILVRERLDHKDERLYLSTFFSENDNPDKPGNAVLRRWDEHKNDYKEADSQDFSSRVRARPLSKIMQLRDYDHDGNATEFMLQVGELPCGKKMSIIIGISRQDQRLHYFSSAEHPEKPLMLQSWQWEKLQRAKSHVKVVDWPCGDHGSETETELELWIDKKGIHATKREYQCDGSDKRGKLISTERI